VPEFLSDEWFRRARELVPPPATVSRLSFRLQYDAEGARWHQVVVDGAITEWAAGDVADPDLELRLPYDVAHRYHRGEADGTETLEACRIVLPDGREGAPPPLDIAERPELDELPFQPDATLLTQYRHRAGPFGPFDWWWQFVDGRSEVMAFGEVEDPDVVVKIRFERLIGVRTGAISIYEAIEGGRVDGDVGPLMLLAGMYESPELHGAELACGPAGRVLADLGTLLHQPEHQEAMATLTAETT
jgi:hypothetical protein